MCDCFIYKTYILVKRNVYYNAITVFNKLCDFKDLPIKVFKWKL